MNDYIVEALKRRTDSRAGKAAGERTRLACWRSRPRDRELFPEELSARRRSAHARRACSPILLLVLLLMLDRNADALDFSGYGPPTSVPVERSTVARMPLPPRNWIDQTRAEADAKSVGCLECHKGVEPMHKAEFVVLGCTDCHGGNPARRLTKEQAHVLPRNKEFWKTSANPPNSNAWLNHESPEFIRFINPGDLRVAAQACGLCHGEIIRNVDHSMMNHGAMLWGAALYNNGALSLEKLPLRPGLRRGWRPLRLVNYTPVTAGDTQVHGHSAVHRTVAAFQS